MDQDGWGLVHAPVRSHKTAGRSTTKNRLLPLMGLTRGLSEGSWAIAMHGRPPGCKVSLTSKIYHPCPPLWVTRH
eukprot:4356402-Amphidinium_carterae.1